MGKARARYGTTKMGWQEAFNSERTAAHQALRPVMPGMRVYTRAGQAEPEVFLEAIFYRTGSLALTREIVPAQKIGTASAA